MWLYMVGSWLSLLLDLFCILLYINIFFRLALYLLCQQNSWWFRSRLNTPAVLQETIVYIREDMSQQDEPQCKVTLGLVGCSRTAWRYIGGSQYSNFALNLQRLCCSRCLRRLYVATLLVDEADHYYISTKQEPIQQWDAWWDGGATQRQKSSNQCWWLICYISKHNYRVGRDWNYFFGNVMWLMRA